MNVYERIEKTVSDVNDVPTFSKVLDSDCREPLLTNWLECYRADTLK